MKNFEESEDINDRHFDLNRITIKPCDWLNGEIKKLEESKEDDNKTTSPI